MLLLGVDPPGHLIDVQGIHPVCMPIHPNVPHLSLQGPTTPCPPYPKFSTLELHPRVNDRSIKWKCPDCIARTPPMYSEHRACSTHLFEPASNKPSKPRSANPTSPASSAKPSNQARGQQAKQASRRQPANPEILESSSHPTRQPSSQPESNKAFYRGLDLVRNR